MPYISDLKHHPETRKERFAEKFWPRTNNSKEIDEWWILMEFFESAGISVKEPPVKLTPPRPDFHCFLDGREILIELGEILESTLAEGLAFSGKQATAKMEVQLQGDQTKANSIVTMGARAFPANQFLEKILRQKLANCYETQGVRSELILFYDRQTPYGPVEYLSQWGKCL